MLFTLTFSDRQGFRYIVPRLSSATSVSRLSVVDGLIPEIAEIEGLKLWLSDYVPVFLISRYGHYGHGQDVGI